MEPVTPLEDTNWYQVSRSTDTRYASRGSPQAESSLPPISKPVRRSAGGHSPEPSTPRRLSRSRGLSQSQNSLAKPRLVDAGDRNAYVRHNFTTGHQTEKILSHNPAVHSDFPVSREDLKRGGNMRTVPQLPGNKRPQLEHDWLIPAMSVGSVDARAIKFLAADNTLRSSPASRRKARTTIPCRTVLTNPTAHVSNSPVKRISTDSRERFHLRLSHSPSPGNSQFTVTSQTKDRNRLNQKDKNQRVPQENSLEKTVSIRRKIEQYRKKFDEQYTDKLKRLKLEGELESQHVRPNSLPFSGIDFAQILESRMHQDLTPLETPPKLGHTMNGDAIVNAKNNDPLLMAPSLFEHRPASGVTWKTWRDVNYSDAYNDVAKYIRDNDLMDAEREQWIRAWLADVETAMKDVDQDSETILMDSQLI